MSILTWSENSKLIQIGKVYIHYKGKKYEVISIARHSETLEEYVVYKALYDDFGVWIRPLNMFLEEIEINGIKTTRFKLITD